ncbi:hydrogenase maturation nickel metallochaperone HypA [Syntrophomonas wolfei]|uniref:hydrogenase maturation nickel metallochaperone HypA n=1 Tax=Syntrophomonas wolfei TaxID=863 RepID=UPI0023F3D020|nr:hydrogenase maturation nickel metallochaperone HypA [Syntrophomonas wolfei]
MHEVTLIEGVMNTVRASALEHDIGRITRVKLVIGKLSMALPDSLQFAFQVLGEQDDLFRGAQLEIEEQEIQCRCSDCQQEFVVDKDYHFVCNFCNGVNVEIIRGRELYIDHYEGDKN